MLPRYNRLDLRSFPTFFKSAARQKTRFFTIHYLPSTSPAWTVVVSKSVAPKATDRNSLKRKGRSAVHHIIKAGYSPNLHAAVVLYAASKKLSVPELAQEIKNAIQKIVRE